MYFEIIGQITDVETIAMGPSVRERGRLRNNLARDVGGSIEASGFARKTLSSKYKARRK